MPLYFLKAALNEALLLNPTSRAMLKKEGVQIFRPLVNEIMEKFFWRKGQSQPHTKIPMIKNIKCPEGMKEINKKILEIKQ